MFSQSIRSTGSNTPPTVQDHEQVRSPVEMNMKKAGMFNVSPVVVDPDEAPKYGGVLTPSLHSRGSERVTASRDIVIMKATDYHVA